MKKFERHIFICINKGTAEKPKGCGLEESEEIQKALKAKVKELGLNKQVRVNKSGCLGACAWGITAVVYPEQVWYGGIKIDDIDEILNEHLIKGNPVERLIIKDEKFYGK